MNKSMLEFTCGIAGSFFGALVGGWDVSFRVMLLLMLCDIIVGIVDVVFFGVSKYGKGVSSSALFQGCIRKGLMLIVVVVGAQMDIVFQTEFIRSAVIMYVIACEGISIIENLIKIGVPAPEFLKKILEVTKEQAEKGGENNEIS